MVPLPCGYHPTVVTPRRMSESELGEKDIDVGWHQHQPGTEYRSPSGVRTVFAKAGRMSDSKWGEEGSMTGTGTVVIMRDQLPTGGLSR